MIKEQKCQTVKEVMFKYKGLGVKEKKGGTFLFNMYMTREMRETSIDSLELSVRSSHVLKRAGYHTIGDVVYAISDGTTLNSLRNCGAKSVREIMEHMFLYQFYQLQPERRDEYLEEVSFLNCYGKAANRSKDPV